MLTICSDQRQDRLQGVAEPVLQSRGRGGDLVHRADITWVTHHLPGIRRGPGTQRRDLEHRADITWVTHHLPGIQGGPGILRRDLVHRADTPWGAHHLLGMQGEGRGPCIQGVGGNQINRGRGTCTQELDLGRRGEPGLQGEGGDPVYRKKRTRYI